MIFILVVQWLQQGGTNMCENKEQDKKKKYVNGFIDIDLMPKDICNTLVMSLKLQIYEYYKNLNKEQPP